MKFENEEVTISTAKLEPCGASLSHLARAVYMNYVHRHTTGSIRLSTACANEASTPSASRASDDLALNEPKACEVPMRTACSENEPLACIMEVRLEIFKLSRALLAVVSHFLETQQHKTQRRRSGQSLHEHDLLVGSSSSIESSDDHTAEEEGLELLSHKCIWVSESPEKSSG